MLASHCCTVYVCRPDLQAYCATVIDELGKASARVNIVGIPFLMTLIPSSGPNGMPHTVIGLIITTTAIDLLCLCCFFWLVIDVDHD